MKDYLLKNKFIISLFFILILAFFLRIYNINWDQNMHLHPDERAIIMYTLPLDIPENFSEFLSRESPLNPDFFAYGNLPLYLLKLLSTAAAFIDPIFAEYDGINLVGRFFSAAIDTLTIILIFKIGTILFNKKVGLVSAALYAFSVFPIQLAHFFTADTLLTFFIILTLYRLIKFYEKPTIKNSIFIGVAFGLSLSTKISAISLIIAIGFAITIDFLLLFLSKPHHFKAWFPHIPKLIKRLFTDGLAIFFSAFITFVITQPYALIDYRNFIQQNLLQSQMTHNAYIFPYTLQYVTKAPVIHEIANIFLWGQGVFIAGACLLGVIFVLARLNKFNSSQKSKIIILYSFLFIFFITVSNFAVGWMRYLLPIYPLLCLSGGFYITNFLLPKISGLNKVIKAIVFLTALILVLIWPLSFLNIYNSPHPRIEASKWINSNIPKGSVLAVEHWDDRLPLRYSSTYVFEELALYEQPDDERKWGILKQQLDNSDYIILSSDRLYVPLQKLEDCSIYKKCYPLTAEYYRNLFAGNLGFEKIAEFSSYPMVPFLNIEIHDDMADESFRVYDHPRVIIFKKSRL